MRITSLLLALTIVGGLLYWFHLRHQSDSLVAIAATGSDQPVSGAVTRTDTPEPAASEESTRPLTDAVATASGDAVPVMVLQSQARSTTTRLVVRGRTEAVRNVAVSAQTTGRVVSLPLRRGSRVVKGQPLCELDPGIRAAELAEAEASLTEAEAEADASKRLSQKGFAAENTLKTRTARLQAAQARLDRVKWDIDQLVIRAPFDGVLETDSAELGTFLSPGNVCATVIDLSEVKVSGFVSEQEIDLLAVGQRTKARLINGIEAQGTISFLSRMADEQTRTFGVEVVLNNPEGRIRDGMTAELMIELPERTGHLVPQSALTLDDQGRLGVRVDEAGIARFRPVRILADEPTGVWIGGLEDSVGIIVVGQEFVRDGRRIAATPADWSALQ